MLRPLLPSGLADKLPPEASGAARDIKLYTAFTVDWLTLPAVGPAAIGTCTRK